MGGGVNSGADGDAAGDAGGLEAARQRMLFCMISIRDSETRSLSCEVGKGESQKEGNHRKLRIST
jgi:hypothetical protein